MTNTICNRFQSYVQNAENIFDIMAASYIMLSPFEPALSVIQDPVLRDTLSRFKENTNKIYAFDNLKEELIEWIYSQENMDIHLIRKKLFFMIRLIDGKCIADSKSSLPDSYIQYFSLNHMFQNEISILPRFHSIAIDSLSDTIAQEDNYGFYGRNYSKTADISGYLNNFIIYKKSYLNPSINLSNQYKEIRTEFKRKNYKLKVAVFPLSNINIKNIFETEEDIVNTNGLFRIKSPVKEQEDLLSKRYKKALEICRDQGVDIAVFPEMLLTEKILNDIIDFIKTHEDKEKRFPWFTWLGTIWEKRENKCMVIDQYGKIVFEQKKYVPYEYTQAADQKKTEERCKIKTNERIKIREDLSHENKWTVQFLDLPGFFRIATAICRDISDEILKSALKELYTNMLIIPAFSETNRLTKRHIDTLAREQIIILVCNACSALCEKSKEKFEINEQKRGKNLTFCYLCMPAKSSEDNIADYHMAKYNSACKKCSLHCNGFIWEIDFSTYQKKNNCYSAKINKI